MGRQAYRLAIRKVAVEHPEWGLRVASSDETVVDGELTDGVGGMLVIKYPLFTAPWQQHSVGGISKIGERVEGRTKVMIGKLRLLIPGSTCTLGTGAFRAPQVLMEHSGDVVLYTTIKVRLSDVVGVKVLKDAIDQVCEPFLFVSQVKIH